MNKRNPIRVSAIVALVAILLATNSWADDVGGAEWLLCASIEATH